MRCVLFLLVRTAQELGGHGIKVNAYAPGKSVARILCAINYKHFDLRGR